MEETYTAEVKKAKRRGRPKKSWSYDGLLNVIKGDALYRLASNEELIDLLNRMWRSEATRKNINCFAEEIEVKTKGKNKREIIRALRSAVVIKGEQIERWS